MERQIRVLLCGTVFGQIYLRGVLRNHNYKLMGILSKGSGQSEEIARQYNVRLHKSIDDIEDTDYDLALVVVRSKVAGGKGSEIAGKLLEKGISVIQEQPVHSDEVIENYKIAVKNHVFYKINTFYSCLPASRMLQERVKKLKETTGVYEIEGACCMPVLLPFLDQICTVAGCVHPYKIYREKCFCKGSKIIISADIGNISCVFAVSKSMNSRDIEKYAYPLNRINIMTTTGNLIMTEVNGQIIWVAKPYIVEEYLKEDKPDKARDVYGTKILYDAGNRRFSELYDKEWPEGVSCFLEENLMFIREKKCDLAKMQYYLALCELWKNISVLISEIQQSEES